MKHTLVVVLLAFAAAAPAAEVKTGGSRMIEVDGKYHVWTKALIISDMTASIR